MVSKGFSLNLGEGTKKDACVRILLAGIFFALVVLVIIFAVYAFKSGDFEEYGCGNPKLDMAGLSNWTDGASKIAFGCFPGYFMDVEDSDNTKLLISTCNREDDGRWNPPTPSCNFLPMTLNCTIDRNGLLGTIILWQNSTEDKTEVHVLIDYTEAAKKSDKAPHLALSHTLSKANCHVENNFTTTEELPTPHENSTNIIQVNFVTDMVAYRNVEAYLTLYFVNETTTPYTLSISQGNITMVKHSNFLRSGLDTDIEELSNFE